MTTLIANPAANPSLRQPQELLATLLDESRELTAVERFAKLHDDGAAPEQAKYYRDLIPAGLPEAGQQYAFDVDLDACSGCKACVSACHHLNGLEPDETWRSVGLLIGQTSATSGDLPILQHVTTACHHCVDPGCLAGCPTNAYEKDPVTGIVRHLDDQCFGCQYCTMACPYEVPQYSQSKGIVRKCDMCHGRLAAGEAPACVQACPNGAIRIGVVDISDVLTATEQGVFLPDTPPSELTHPTTTYRSQRGLPAGTAGADGGFAEPQHAHAPLVAMLVLTQMSVGVVAASAIARWLGSGAWCEAGIIVGMIVGQLGLAVAPLHLGRPHLAFRAVLGWRHSWLSREAILFGVYAAFSVAAAAFAIMPHLEGWLPTFATSAISNSLPAALRSPLEALALLSGAVAVYCSAKIYIFTGRVFWEWRRTLPLFGGTSVVLGLAATASVAAIAGFPSPALTWFALLVAAAKLLYEASLFRHVHDADGDLRLTAKLQLGQLRPVTTTRMILGAAGVMSLLVAGLDVAPATFATLGFVSLLAAEFAERWLYFSTVIPLRMPGGTPTR
ncbi:DmsC/YnfH family molybdoenzyme membrane anchor subunit [Botrimarina mediterranea]|uniref:Anaerobic dimethyl sulfoxide reductase chain B n=1 Tax=Botrimarina mediterranea TaxID=2528022 RepID=A0A518K810_9BACT|nr:DmsC/YnfH family molybdoenzyme membrane anchor subunit [Botrimarina mediterranea]QDV73929.1 Anaerobic dimethyl sulfoxide reductase chain B [Botrimarina mediterranea]QDV78559.1 Anaerobic dimethyl sulfoxide reductase chain B [Planctomycetes bacterium K2D]